MKLPATPAPSLNSRIIGHGVTPISDDHDAKWGVPTLAELGLLLLLLLMMLLLLFVILLFALAFDDVVVVAPDDDDDVAHDFVVLALDDVVVGCSR